MTVAVMFIAVENCYDDGGSYFQRNTGEMARCKASYQRTVFEKKLDRGEIGCDLVWMNAA
jgi:hypothetical protein